MKVNGVSDDALRLYLFPYSLQHRAAEWFDRLPRNSITTFDQMAKIFLGKYFPSSMVTKLRNDIMNFRQEPDESHRDTINAAAGGTFMKRRPEECYDLIENMTAHYNDWDTSAQRIKAVTPSCETCGGPHAYNDCPSTVGQTQNVYAAGAYNQGGNSYQPQGANHVQNPPPAYQAPAHQAPGNQAPVHQAPIPQPQGVTNAEFSNYIKANDAILKNMQTNMTSLTNSNLELKNMFGQFMKMNTASTSGSGTLPSNTVTNPKEDLKGITTRSGVAYQGPTIPTTSSSPPKVVERETEVTKDTVPPTNNGSTEDVQPPVVQVENQVPISEPVVTPVSASMPNLKPSIPYPSRRNDERNRQKANNQIEKFYQIFQDMSFEISFVDALILMPKFASTLKALIGNKEKLSKMARTPLNEHCSAVILNKLPEKLGDPGKFLIPCDFPGMDECLALADLGASINLMPLSVWKKLSFSELTPTRSFLKTGRALIDVYEGELTLRVGNKAVTFNLDQTLRYSANYNDMTANRIDVIDMACEEYSQEVLGFSVVSANIILSNVLGSSILDAQRSGETVCPTMGEPYFQLTNDVMLSQNKFSSLQKPYTFPFTLNVLDLSSNKLKGDISVPPTEIYAVNYSNNEFGSSIQADFGNALTSAFSFSTSNSKVIGVIPESINNAEFHRVLDLSSNALIGPIPLVGSMQYLESLDLSLNKLSGRIVPQQLTCIMTLEFVNVSYNRLSSKIPEG
ncbi:reverse transcriptase domain-containing protein [Tanacetum coccineum]|uniref:Reverse transcriptase domain-containing protein n=1 Tax=Tanacetum coccineum TaxID=301880 RepID=A0ABQ5H0X9_9ASTR